VGQAREAYFVSAWFASPCPEFKPQSHQKKEKEKKQPFFKKLILKKKTEIERMIAEKCLRSRGKIVKIRESIAFANDPERVGCTGRKAA
jgi:hypothetical protein